MDKMKNIFSTVLCIILLLIICMVVQARTASPKIADFLITNDEEKVLLYARLVDGFKSEMKSEILAGVPQDVVLRVKVYEERPWWIWDKKINQSEIKRTIRYDNLIKTFTITTNGNPDPDHGPRLELQNNQGGISRLAPWKLASPLQSLPPILHKPAQSSLSSYSKGARGLSV